jgi:uncharacterized protein (TIGR00725 family)
MGGASDAMSADEKGRLNSLAQKLCKAIVDQEYVLVTGATTGIPHMVSQAVRSIGGLTIGISPAIDRREHDELYRLPLDGADLIIFTGFGLKGRNVINIRSSDIVIIFGGGMGALNEFTIAYDEGKIIGVLEGSGGVADHIRKIIEFAGKPTKSRVHYDDDPEELLRQCARMLAERNAS